MADSAPDNDAVDVCDEGQMYVYSEEDLSNILADAWVDMREVVGDDAAAECLDICYNRLTDDFYTHE